MTAAPQSNEARLSFKEVRELQPSFERKSAVEVLEFALSKFGRQLAVATSFSAEDVVLIDLARKIDPSVRLFTIDTGRLPSETYDVWSKLVTQLDVSIETLFPDSNAVFSLVEKNGPNGFYNSLENRRECCDVRKVKPLKSLLGDLGAWATGMRRQHSANREAIQKIEADLMNGGVVKFNPLADWSDDQVWSHIRDHDLPYNALHDQGFPSIGCAPCTRAVQPGQDPRSGRWWWESADENECGIHSHVTNLENEDG